jgi:AraC-like DNA-binding protein
MPNITILSGKRQQLDSDWAKGGREEIANDFDRFYLLERGRIEVTSETGSTTVGETGCICCFPGGPSRRRYRCLEEMDLSWLHLRLEFHPGLNPFHSFSPPSRIPLTDDLKAIFSGIQDLVSSRTPQAALLGTELVCKLYRPFLPNDWDQLYPDRRAMERLEPALIYMERNAGRSLSLDELAQAVCLHPTYFSNLFRATFGRPPMRFHTGLRIRRSQSLLLNTNFQSVGDVSRACGFEDPLHFSRVFRNHTGTSPSLYRKKRGVVHP